jgi:putative ATP-binding cassette transporter
MKLIAFIFRYSRRTAVLAVVAGLVGGACSTALIAVVNEALKGSPGPDLLRVFVALCVVLPLARFAAEWLLLRLGQDAMLELRMQLGRQILAAPLRRLEEVGSHRLLATLTDDIPIIANSLLMIPTLCINIAMVVGGLVYLGLLSWPMLLALLVLMALGVASYQLPVIRATSYFRRAREHTDALMKHFRALTDGAKELKLNRVRRAAFFDEVLGETAVSFRRESVRGMTLYSAAASWGQTLAFIVIGLLLFGAPAVYGAGVGALSGFVLAVLFMMTPLQVVMNIMPVLSRAAVAVSKVEALGLSLSTSREAAVAESASDLPADWQRLEVRGLAHTYRVDGEDDNFTLGPLDITLRPGDLVFLVGGNGSGKTTLAKLLAGLYTPEAGEIRLDGRAVTDENRDHYRQLFSAVFSDFHLFDSLLGFDRRGLDEQAAQYLSRLNLSHKVSVRDGALTTTELSQGQRKRLALLTAYLEDRPIYLFDEWAADQDPQFKQVFYHQLLPELKEKGKTLIVISHDDQYYHLADRVIKLNYGQIELDLPAGEAAAHFARTDGAGAVTAQPAVLKPGQGEGFKTYA